MMSEFTVEEKTKIQNVVGVVEDNIEEINRLNHRLFELREEFYRTFDENGIDEIFQEYDRRSVDNYRGYETDEFDQVLIAARNLGIGFSYEEYYLWQPSTASC